MNKKDKQIKKDLAGVINHYSLENDSNTPDLILAEYLYDCLKNFAKTSMAREKWYGKNLSIQSNQEK